MRSRCKNKINILNFSLNFMHIIMNYFPFPTCSSSAIMTNQPYRIDNCHFSDLAQSSTQTVSMFNPKKMEGQFNPVDMKRLYYTVLFNDRRSHLVKEDDIKSAIQNMGSVYKPDKQNLTSPTRRLADYNTVAHRCAYLHKYAPFHTAMVSDILKRILFHNQDLYRTFQQSATSSKFKICSLGGGPGNDIVGTVAALTELFGVFPCSARVVDVKSDWKNTLRSVINEMRSGDYGIVGQCFNLKIFDWGYLTADLLDEMESDVEAAIGKADLVTMVKFVSAAACLSTESMLMKIFTMLKTGSTVLFIDNSGGGFGQLVYRAAEKCGLIYVLGPINNEVYSNEWFNVSYCDYSSCFSTTVTIHMLRKVDWHPNAVKNGLPIKRIASDVCESSKRLRVQSCDVPPPKEPEIRCQVVNGQLNPLQAECLVEKISTPVARPGVEKISTPVAQAVVEEISTPVAHAGVEKISAPIAHAGISSKSGNNKIVINCPIEVNNEKPIITNNPVQAKCLVEKISNPVAQAEIEKISNPVYHAGVEKILTSVAHAEVEKISTPVAHALVENISSPVAHALVENISTPVAHALVENISTPVAHAGVENISTPVAHAEVEKISTPVAHASVDNISTPVAHRTVEKISTQVAHAGLSTKHGNHCIATRSPLKEINKNLLLTNNLNASDNSSIKNGLPSLDGKNSSRVTVDLETTVLDDITNMHNYNRGTVVHSQQQKANRNPNVCNNGAIVKLLPNNEENVNSLKNDFPTDTKLPHYR